MITGLPVSFSEKINSIRRKPVQLCHFHYNGKTYLLSDCIVGVGDGLMYDYDPVVESWGEIKDTTNNDISFINPTLDTKSTKLSIIITSDYNDLLKEALINGVDNSVVEIYQWFIDLPNDPPVLVDVFVAQDPISYSEKSMIFSIDLVSVIMKSNQYLWDVEAGDEVRDIAIGKATNLKLYDQQTARVTNLDEGITFDYTGEVFIANGIGFRAGPDKLNIDSEVVSYDWITASTVNVTARGVDGTTARPHIRGALICHPDANFDYSICAGPVQEISNLRGDGDPYTQPVTFFPGQNPAIARFTGRPPWLKVKPYSSNSITPDPETIIEYASDVKNTAGDTASPAHTPEAINAPSGAASMYIVNSVGGGTKNIYGSNYPKTSFNLDLEPYMDELYGTNAISTNYGTYMYAYGANPYDNIEGYYALAFPYDWTYLGTLNSVEVTVNIGLSLIRAANGEISIVFVGADGTEHILDSQSIDNPSNTTINYFKFNNTSWTFDVTAFVDNFADLPNCWLRLVVKNIEAYDKALYQGINSVLQSLDWEISYLSDGVVYSPWQQLLSDFNRDLSSLGTLTSIECDVRFGTSVSNADVERKIVFNGATLWSDTITASSQATTHTITPSIASFAELETAEIGVYHRIIGPDTGGLVRQSNTSFEYVKWRITYQPSDINVPDEERVVYAEELVCDVTSTLGEDPTPPEVLKYIFNNHSDINKYVNLESFDARHVEYDLDAYYLNGVLAGDIRLHDAIKTCLKEGMCKLLYSQGTISLVSYNTYSDSITDYILSDDGVLFKSKSVRNQDTSTIKNDISISYNHNPSENVFETKTQLSDVDSIAKYQRQEYRDDYKLIKSNTTAESMSLYILSALSNPQMVMNIDAFMNAYILEKGDKIQFSTFFDSVNATGVVVSNSRDVGKGKNNKMNVFKLSIARIEYI